VKIEKACPDECPTCGCDLKYQGCPERHQDDSSGEECPWGWSPEDEEMFA